MSYQGNQLERKQYDVQAKNKGTLNMNIIIIIPYILP